MSLILHTIMIFFAFNVYKHEFKLKFVVKIIFILFFFVENDEINCIECMIFVVAFIIASILFVFCKTLLVVQYRIFIVSKFFDLKHNSSFF